MNTIFFEIVIIFLLLLANGVFALAEISVVSSRKGRLKMLADKGSPAAAKALALAEDPGRFLSTVQIGITLVGILAGAFGGATLSEQLALTVAQVPGLAPSSKIIGLIVVVGAIIYASLIIGELVPKRIGLNNPEKKAMLVAVPLSALCRFVAPGWRDGASESSAKIPASPAARGSGRRIRNAGRFRARPSGTHPARRRIFRVGWLALRGDGYGPAPGGQIAAHPRGKSRLKPNLSGQRRSTGVCSWFA